MLARTISSGGTVSRDRRRASPSICRSSRSSAAAADLVEVLAHRGQRRGEVGRLGDVVEADDADVLGDPAAELVQAPQDAQRHLVVGHEDGGDARVGEPGAGQLVARAGAPVADEQRRLRRRRRRRASRASRARGPAPRASPAARRCARPCDGRVQSRCRVAARGARDLVDARPAGCRRARAGLGGDDRDVRRRRAAAPAPRTPAARSRGSRRRPARPGARRRSSIEVGSSERRLAMLTK